MVLKLGGLGVSVAAFCRKTPSDGKIGGLFRLLLGLRMLAVFQVCPSLTQQEAKQLLQKTAKRVGQGDWDPSSGAGIIQAKTAYEILRKEM